MMHIPMLSLQCTVSSGECLYESQCVILPDRGFSMVRIIAVPYFLAALDKIEITRYVLSGSKSQVGSSSNNITVKCKTCYIIIENWDCKIPTQLPQPLCMNFDNPIVNQMSSSRPNVLQSSSCRVYLNILAIPICRLLQLQGLIMDI